MNYQFVIRPIARRNLAAIERWYDERSEGLSYKFRLGFEETLERINRLPFRPPIIHNQTRRIEHPKRFMVDPNGR